MIPQTYDPQALERELTEIRRRLDDFYTRLYMVPQATEPSDPQDGWIVNSDGSWGTAGLNRWDELTTTWVSIG